MPPFELSLKGVGYFPPRRHPRILWAGVAENPELFRLQGKIERALNSIGIAPEQRRFHPHITIARLNEPPLEKIALFMAQNSLFSTELFAVSQFHLYRSYLSKRGAYHQKQATFYLTT